MMKAKEFIRDLKTLYKLTMQPVRGVSHQDRLESFYSSQAEDYDSFRERLLQGRRDLMASLELPGSCRWLDLGAGTGSNLDFVDTRNFSEIDLVDLSGSLLAQAEKKISLEGFKNVKTHEKDVSDFESPQKYDLVTFSYSLTMIPDWFRAIDRAYELLIPGGQIAVVDFYSSRKFNPDSRTHNWWKRHFWPMWFGFDNVNLSPDHLPYLKYRFQQKDLIEGFAKVPYLPLDRVPYYRFVGVKI